MRPTLSRRRLLRLGSAGLAGGLLVAGVGDLAVAKPPPGKDSGLAAQMRQAAHEYGVPVALLMAMGYVNTRLEMPPVTPYREGDPEARGVHGVMALVRNPTADTVGTAARLTGIAPDRLVSDRFANLRGGAALLAYSQGDAHPGRPHDWLPAVAGAGGHGPPVWASEGVGGGDLYAEQVGDALDLGFSVRTRRGEHMRLPPHRAGA